MNRRKFLGIAGGSVLAAGGIYYLLSDKHNFVREDIKTDPSSKSPLQQEEREILYLASLAPSGHNTQPWIVKYVEPYHWIIGNEKTRWLPAVDPEQRETILSIGAFMQNLEYAAAHFGYTCQWTLLATSNHDENIAGVKLSKSNNTTSYDISLIKNRRTLRTGYLNDILRKEDIAYLTQGEPEYFHYIPNTSKESLWINEQTIEANRIQMNRDAALHELAEWIRFSSKDAGKYCDGLTAASMEMDGITGWVIRNFYNKSSVMKKGFRDKGVDKVKKQVSHSAGWLIITSNDSSVTDLLETGRRMQRLFLRVRQKGIALHPMTQILEEAKTRQIANQSIGISNQIQFLLRTGYVKNYPGPVSVRRPVDWIVKF